MCRTIVGVSANLCPVDQAGKNIHSSVSCKFAESIKLVGGLPIRWSKCSSTVLWGGKGHR